MNSAMRQGSFVFVYGLGGGFFEVLVVEAAGSGAAAVTAAFGLVTFGARGPDRRSGSGEAGAVLVMSAALAIDGALGAEGVRLAALAVLAIGSALGALACTARDSGGACALVCAKTRAAPATRIAAPPAAIHTPALLRGTDGSGS
jgi:hypothetical protein